MTEVSSRSVYRALRILLFLAVCLNYGLSAEDRQTTVKSKAQDATARPTKDVPRRDRSHIDSTLGLNSASMHKTEAQLQHNAESIKQLTNIYKTAVRPMEELYNFHSLNKHIMTEAEIKAKPMVLFVGPWSTGKSTMINYLAGITHPLHTLRTGAEPTTSDFTVLMHGETYRTVEGLVLATDSSKGFAALEKFGQGFLEKLQGVEMPYELLRQVTFVDTPGIIENRKQQERGYPFNEVMKWFIERSDLIFVVFDPTKLDVGIELETLFKQLKGREAQIRIILNKADSIAMQELMRVYGALFWSLQPLINVTEPPRVYTGSFWNNPFKLDSIHDLFLKEEMSLLQDLREVISNQLENKVAFVRQHAILVRIHALLVNRYLEVFNTHKSSFSGNEALLADIVENPQNHHIFQSILAEPFVSKYDLPSVDTYKEFFSVSALNTFKALSSHCSLLGGCPMDHLVAAIAKELPRLLKAIKPFTGSCDAESCSKDKDSNP